MNEERNIFDIQDAFLKKRRPFLILLKEHQPLLLLMSISIVIASLSQDNVSAQTFAMTAFILFLLAFIFSVLAFIFRSKSLIPSYFAACLYVFTIFGFCFLVAVLKFYPAAVSLSFSVGSLAFQLAILTVLTPIFLFALLEIYKDADKILRTHKEKRDRIMGYVSKYGIVIGLGLLLSWCVTSFYYIITGHPEMGSITWSLLVGTIIFFLVSALLMFLVKSRKNKRSL